jgi:hypothetical protein
MQKKNTQEKFEDLAKLVLEFRSYFFFHQSLIEANFTT